MPEKDPVREIPEKASPSAKATAAEAGENAKPKENIGDEREREDSEGQKQKPVIGDEKNVDFSPVSSGLNALSKNLMERFQTRSSQSVILENFTTVAGGETKSAIENEALAKPEFRKTEEGKT
ncbi:hypothetical protein HF325_001213 [Metschnikowia pulcherrima]|uniref:Uncharacterized protein n=1 Tax=Metschnikowia pulcherrima TaxID=27326 RepID=A0A8H7LDN1_9ASCO|nr:hypothetical protein HF325_001213 [Metschnikowia pulcherrima]